MYVGILKRADNALMCCRVIERCPLKIIDTDDFPPISALKSLNDHGIARLMLFYVAVCIHIVNEHDYIEKVWSSGISTFEAVIKFIKQMDLGVEMHEEIERVIQLPNQHNEMNYALARIYEIMSIKK